MDTKELLFATSNKNKIREIQSLLPENVKLIGFDEIGFTGDIAETAETIEGNAHLKAAFIGEHFEISCFAEDTGLEILALGGKPGVRSARYAGEPACNQDNISLVLLQMADKTDRKARFKTVISFFDGSKFHSFEGICNGYIASEAKGKDGFGYDPIFIPEGSGLTFAEMTLEEKNKFSHRKKAFSKLMDYLNSEMKQVVR